jgi:hypothetical protein
MRWRPSVSIGLLMSGMGLGRVKTKSDLVLMPSGRQILRFFALRMTVKPKIPGAVIPPSVFTRPGSLGDIGWSPSYVSFTPESGPRDRWHL